MKTSLRHITITTLILTALSCNSSQTQPEIIPTVDDNIVYIEEDAAINRQCMDSVEQNWAQFEAIFNQHAGDTAYWFYAKSVFEDGPEKEHMWIGVTSVEGDSLRGILDNEPIVVTNIAYLDNVSRHKGEIEDFLIYKNDSLLLGDYMSKIMP